MVEHLGKYELLKKIAAGGMAEILVARAHTLPGVEKVVVIKRLLPQFSAKQEFIDMFLDEARIAATLNHPNVVQMYDFGPMDGGYFMALEYLHGEDLRAINRKHIAQERVMPLEHALTIVSSVAGGLHHAHEAKGFDGRDLAIVHRDVSPHNVFVTFDGAVKLVDFGIAKSKNRVSQTRHGTLKGKVPYMAPEQLKNEPLDRRADIYALGVILYEVTTGQRPYVVTNGGEFALMMSIVRGQVRTPSIVRADYPRELEAIVLRALARRPEQRYQTARDFQVALEEYAASAGLRVGATPLSEYMHQTFGSRLERWGRAQAAGKDFAEHVVEIEVERANSEVRDDTDSETVDPTELNFRVDWDESTDSAPMSSTLRGITAAGVDIATQTVGSVEIVTISGRLTESFMGKDVGSALRGTVVLDLAHVERITSFGVREWLEMMTAARASGAELFLARMSEVVTTQMSMIRSFAGPGHVASFYAPYLCDSCGKNFRVLIDCERDASVIEQRQAPQATCTVCGGGGALDEDPSYLGFASAHAGAPVPAPVRAALDSLREVNAPPSAVDIIEKLVVGNVTRLRLRAPVDRVVRWNRVLDGLEGNVVIDFQTTRVTPEAAMNLANALRAVSPDVTSIDLSSCPLVVLEALGTIGRLDRIHLVSANIEGVCPACRASRSAIVQAAECESAAGGGALRLPCRRCNTPLDLGDLGKTLLSFFGGPVTRSSPAAALPAVTHAARSWRKPPFAVLVACAAFAGFGLLTTGVVLAVHLGETSNGANVHPPAADATTPLPLWTKDVVVREGQTVLLVGKSGLVATQEEGLAIAQADAVRLLGTVVVGEMKPSPTKAFLATRTEIGANARFAAEDLRAASERYLRDVGATSTPERVEVVVRRAENGVEIYARYVLGEDALRAAVATYSRATSLGGGVFIPTFPLLVGRSGAGGGVMVAAADDRGTRAGLVPGDVVVSVDGHAVVALESFNSLTMRAKTYSLQLVASSGEQKRVQLTR